MASNTVALFTIYLLVVFYALCYQLQAPIEPFLVEKLIGKDGDSAVAFGRLGSFFSIVQTVGSLSFGYLLDRAGVRIGFGEWVLRSTRNDRLPHFRIVSARCQFPVLRPHLLYPCQYHVHRNALRFQAPWYWDGGIPVCADCRFSYYRG
jgi:hypothetical protein